MQPPCWMMNVNKPCHLNQRSTNVFVKGSIYANSNVSMYRPHDDNDEEDRFPCAFLAVRMRFAYAEDVPLIAESTNIERVHKFVPIVSRGGNIGLHDYIDSNDIFCEPTALRPFKCDLHLLTLNCQLPKNSNQSAGFVWHHFICAIANNSIEIIPSGCWREKHRIPLVASTNPESM